MYSPEDQLRVGQSSHHVTSAASLWYKLFSSHSLFSLLHLPITTHFSLLFLPTSSAVVRATLHHSASAALNKVLISPGIPCALRLSSPWIPFHLTNTHQTISKWQLTASPWHQPTIPIILSTNSVRIDTKTWEQPWAATTHMRATFHQRPPTLDGRVLSQWTPRLQSGIPAHPNIIRWSRDANASTLLLIIAAPTSTPATLSVCNPISSTSWTMSPISPITTRARTTQPALSETALPSPARWKLSRSPMPRPSGRLPTTRLPTP